MFAGFLNQEPWFANGTTDFEKQKDSGNFISLTDLIMAL
jgi:hypothetical protein